MSSLALFYLIFINILRAFSRDESITPPGNLSLSEIPMFITITFDDALHGEALKAINKIAHHKNYNNENIPMVFFVSTDYTDYQHVQESYLHGDEIAVHTVTHTTGTSSNLTKWYTEITKCREYLNTHAGIPFQNIKGFRAPFLEKSDLSFQVLYKNGFLYDSTITQSRNTQGYFRWPFTLDTYVDTRIINVGQGPQQAYPGLWEMPMYSIYSSPTTQMSSMDYTGDYTTILKAFKDTFNHRLSTNKAPFGVFLHSSWMHDTNHVDALSDFIAWAKVHEPNTWVVTNQQIIDWMINPITNTEINQNGKENYFKNKNAIDSSLKNAKFQTCYYKYGFIKTIMEECPLTYPGIEFTNKMIFTNITINSLNNSYLEPKNVCINDNYPTYNPSTIYCQDTSIITRVIYDNKIYECKWWTQGEMPLEFGSSSHPWKFIKNCIQYTRKFKYGYISNYGSSIFFLGNKVNININAYDGYYIDSIKVDNSHIIPFDQYSITVNDSKNILFSINLCKIVKDSYKIDITFKPGNMTTIKSFKQGSMERCVPITEIMLDDEEEVSMGNKYNLKHFNFFFILFCFLCL